MRSAPQVPRLFNITVHLKWAHAEFLQLDAGTGTGIDHAGHLSGFIFGVGCYTLYRLVNWVARARGGGVTARQRVQGGTIVAGLASPVQSMPALLMYPMVGVMVGVTAYQFSSVEAQERGSWWANLAKMVPKQLASSFGLPQRL
jgi:hypothetical protein